MSVADDAVLHVLRDPPRDGPTNMARDEVLLYSERLKPAALRLYRWSPPTLSLGYFQRAALLDTLPQHLRALPVVRRATGGGAILHHDEITYSLMVAEAVPAARQSPVALYRLVHACWRDALAEAGVTCELAPEHYPLPTPRTGPFFCFEKPGQTDLIIGDQKLLGSAQRRMPGRVLQHGSLILGQPIAGHPGANLGGLSAAAQSELEAHFLHSLARALDLSVSAAAWSDAESAEADLRREKFASEAWTLRL